MDLLSLTEAPEGGDEPAMPVVRYISGEQVFREIDSITSINFETDSGRGIDTLLVTSVSRAAFGMLDRKREARGRKFRFNWYDEDSRRLLVSLGTAAHVQLDVYLYYNGIWDALMSMGLCQDSWLSMGATTHYHGGLCSGEALGNSSVGHGNGGGSSGEPDSSGGPRPERSGPGKFPTLVIESGCSRPLSIMQAKARWWFKISNHDVKIVLLAKLYEREQKIVVEKWEEGPREVREGATTTRWGAEGVPYCQQVVTITKICDNPSFHQISGDLVLSFRLLFLREPREGEKDVVITANRL